MRQIRTYLTMAVVALAAASLTAAAPAIAHGVDHALFAHDAGRVDGKNAVAATATPEQRANKLVATDGTGRLPDDIIAGDGFVRGHGVEVLSSRRIRTNGSPDVVLLELPGLGTLHARCPDAGTASVVWENTSSHTVDLWRDVSGGIVWTTAAPDDTAPVVEVDIAAGEHNGSLLELGWGNGTIIGRNASVRAYVGRDSWPGPCAFQARATVWSAG